MTDTERTRGTTTGEPTTDETATTDTATGTEETTTQTDSGPSFEDVTDAKSDDTDAVDRFYASTFTVPGAPEASPDGAWLAYLQPDAAGERHLWIAPTDGGEPQRLEIPFTPVEDVDPVSGRIVRGPQWSPDGSRIAVTGMHPDGDRTAVWIVPVGPEPEPEQAAPAAGTAADPAEMPETETIVATAAPGRRATDDSHHIGSDDHDPHDHDDHGHHSASSSRGYMVGEDDEHHEDAPGEADAYHIGSDAHDPHHPENIEYVTATTVPDYLVGHDDEHHEDAPAPVVDDSAEVVRERHHIGSDAHDPHDHDETATAITPMAYLVGEDDEHLHEEAVALAEHAAEQAKVTGPRLLVDHAVADRSPRWSPDGVLVAMVSTVDGQDVITLTTAEGGDDSAVEMLTWSRSHDREPVWSRDGKFLGFLRQRPEGSDVNDIYSFSLESGELQNLTSEKAPAMRHSPEWVPGRNLIAYVTRENDWLSISVINADNKAGWTVTRESGDKTEPRFAQDEARLVYVRTEGFTTVLCERSLHSSSAVALDPGEGVVRYPRWLDGKRVAYAFSAPQRPIGFLVQENTAKADRTPIVIPEQPSIGGQQFRQPQPFEFEVGPEEMFSGMLYRTPDLSGAVPGIVYLPDGPLATRRGEFQIEEQALASTSVTVLTPVIHGASGFGAAVEDDLRDYADTELESNDLAEAGRALGREESVDSSRIAIVGHGLGGALALVTAGARPGVYSAVVAIDPVVDWSIELAGADVPWRTWVVDRFGMPLTHADHYALRTPATFSAVIDVPMVLVRTERAPEHRKAQLDLFRQDLDELGVSYRVIDAPDEPLSATLRRVGREVAQLFVAG